MRDRRRIVTAAAHDRQDWGARVVQRPTNQPVGPSTEAIIRVKEQGAIVAMNRPTNYRPNRPVAPAASQTTQTAAGRSQQSASTARPVGCTTKQTARPTVPTVRPAKTANTAREQQLRAARFRAALLVALFLLTVTGWLLVAFGKALLLAGVLPTLALTGSLVAITHAAQTRRHAATRPTNAPKTASKPRAQLRQPANHHPHAGRQASRSGQRTDVRVAQQRPAQPVVQRQASPDQRIAERQAQRIAAAG
ncbi:MAG: hypothetical protein LBG70_02905, partial [Bifidobacteriaceae bacterium]|nr:hypothetical protein [Bifidobacteriaceae bacterium]